MRSKYTEAFDSLEADEKIKQKRAERIKAAYEGRPIPQETLAVAEQSAVQEKPAVAVRRKRVASAQDAGQGAAVAVKPKRKGLGRRGIAWLTAVATFVAAVAISIPVGINLYNNRGMLGAMNLLKNTFVDMDGVTAFGVWNAPDSSSSSPRISQVASVRKSSRSEGDEQLDSIYNLPPLPDYEIDDDDDTLTGDGDITGDDITGDETDVVVDDWETDYDWDPTKANVLIAINDDDSIKEVIYERTNGRGQVRQSVLGNAAMVYVSDSFTYVMYVDDDEWDWWVKGNMAQEMRYPSGFSCHHEIMQTVVIHNETGNVFALKDLIPQVNELSGAMNYTMQVQPYENDFISVAPMYGNEIPQWYTVIYDEQTAKIRCELMLPVDVAKHKGYSLHTFVRAARRDKYGQNYLLEYYNTIDDPRITGGIVDMPKYKRYGNSITFDKMNGMLYGSDERVYTFDSGKLKVFGENFELSPVEPGLNVTFEGIANEFFFYAQGENEGIVYTLSDGYLYSAFGQVWSVDEDGTLHEWGQLKGKFPRYADDAWMLGGEIIGYVDVEEWEKYSINGRIVHIKFKTVNGEPKAVVTPIISANEISVQPNNRTVVEQNQNPMTLHRGSTKYFLITVRDGKIIVDFFATGYDGGVFGGLTHPVTEPLKLN